MSKPLMVEFQGQAIPLTLEKVDRSRLYGFVDNEILDTQGQHCELATLNGDGHTLIGRGGTAMVQVSPEGLWRTKAVLKPVDCQGKPLAPVKSSFDATVPLERTASIDEYLAHNIHAIYRLHTEADTTQLCAALRTGTIFMFPFSYRGGLEPDQAFLLLGSDGNLFLALGRLPTFEFVGLRNSAPLAEEEAVEEEESELDFGMI